MSGIDNLQYNKEELAALLSAYQERIATLSEENEHLRYIADEARQERDIAQNEVDKLAAILKQLQRRHYGPCSERHDPDQHQLALEDLEQDLSEAQSNTGAHDNQADDETGEKPAQGRGQRKPKRNQGALPGHLPRRDHLIPPEVTTCACCGREMPAIGEDVTEYLNYLPAILEVIRVRRPRHACSCGEDGVHQAEAPAHPITGSMATTASVVTVLVHKYADALPLYRQAQQMERQGLPIDRSTLARWVGHAAWWLRPLHELLLDTIAASAKIFADDTRLPVLDPGRGKTKTARLWAYGRDDRPWKGPDPPAVAYVFTPDRKHRRPAEQLEKFTGILQVDAYKGFEDLAAKRAAGEVVVAQCWAHARRKVYEVAHATDSPIAHEALERIARLYRVEDSVRFTDRATRLAARQKHSKPIMDAFKPWLEEQLGRLSGKSRLAAAFRYILSHWDGLSRFLEDGRIELDTNRVENRIRPIAVGRKNHLFAGSEGGARTWALFASLIETCRMNDVDPHAYLCDVLGRVTAGTVPASQLHTLLPWNWKSQAHTENA